MTKDDHPLTVQEIAKYGHLSRPAIYLLIARGYLKAVKNSKRWYVYKKDFDEYRANKYSPERRKFNGERLYDIEGGVYSPLYVSKILAENFHEPITVQDVYYFIRSGRLIAQRKGGRYIILEKDLHACIRTLSAIRQDRQLNFG